MKTIEIKFKSGEKEVILTSTPEKPEDALMLIGSIFAFLNEEIEEPLFSRNLTKLQQLYIDFYEKEQLKNATEQNEIIKVEEIENTTSTQSVNPNGIKHYNGKPRYKTKYRCTCGHSGFRFIPHVSSYVMCHQCGKKMKVKYINSNSTTSNMISDEYGIYFESV